MSFQTMGAPQKRECFSFDSRPKAYAIAANRTNAPGGSLNNFMDSLRYLQLYAQNMFDTWNTFFLNRIYIIG